MEPENALPAPGEIVRAKYRVEGIIGSGGMGAVLAARHVVTGKPVALKWLRSSLARDPEWMQRFLREARAAGRIQHPNVVDIYDVEEHRGVLFLVMERLKGRPLSAVLAAESALPWQEAIALMLPVMKGVQAAHRRGVLHRDLKPANIFLCEDDTGAPLAPKVLDFGISKIVDDGDASITETGAQLGTPAYMAPEQLADDKPDRRVDIYALGVILYRMLSGRLPHSAPTPAALAIKIATEDALPLDAVAEVPSELSAIVRQAMARDREARFRDVGALVAALEQFTGAPMRRRLLTPIGGTEPRAGEGTPTPIFARESEASLRRSRWRTYAPWLLAVGLAGTLVLSAMRSLERRGSSETAPSSVGTANSAAHGVVPSTVPQGPPTTVASVSPAAAAVENPRRPGTGSAPGSPLPSSGAAAPSPSRVHREPRAHHVPKNEPRPPSAGTTGPEHAPALRPDEF